LFLILPCCSFHVLVCVYVAKLYVEFVSFPAGFGEVN
jgi:hypothetical protein